MDIKYLFELFFTNGVYREYGHKHAVSDPRKVQYAGFTVLLSDDYPARVYVTFAFDPDKDYKKAFGKESTMISGVAIMTDTDNTRESAVAWYGDIIFRADPGK